MSSEGKESVKGEKKINNELSGINSSLDLIFGLIQDSYSNHASIHNTSQRLLVQAYGNFIEVVGQCKKLIEENKPLYDTSQNKLAKRFEKLSYIARQFPDENKSDLEAKKLVQSKLQECVKIAIGSFSSKESKKCEDILNRLENDIGKTQNSIGYFDKQTSKMIKKAKELTKEKW